MKRGAKSVMVRNSTSSNINLESDQTNIGHILRPSEDKVVSFRLTDVEIDRCFNITLSYNIILLSFKVTNYNLTVHVT